MRKAKPAKAAPPIKAGRPTKDRAALRLHGAIAHDLGVAIVSGRYPPGVILDGEIEASEQLKVSRTAYREAVRILAAKGLVESRPKVGTRVSPRERWQVLDPDVLSWIFAGEPDPALLRALFELRSIVEPAAASLAAMRRGPDHLQQMRTALDGMSRHTLHGEPGRQADQSFHAALLGASGNAFLTSLTNSVTTAIDALTEFKQRGAPLARDPVPDHKRVYDAIDAKDPEAARRAMAELIRLAICDTPILSAAPRKTKTRARASKD
jgi:DNA-binding FadR family transcriptional regulator